MVGSTEDDDPRSDRLGDLVDAAREGSGVAWEELYAALYPRLLAFAHRRLDSEQASDAVSETMARAVAGIGRFTWRGEGGFEGWLFAILRNVIVDKHRRFGRARRLVFQPADLGTVDIASGLLAAEEASAMRVAFGRLPDSDQELLHLRVVVGLSSEVVGTVLGKRPGAVRMAQVRALGRLRGLFEAVAL